MRMIMLRYTLRNGAGGMLPCLCASTADAILWAIGHFGDTLRTCSAQATEVRHV
jgi:hypothetical protein